MVYSRSASPPSFYLAKADDMLSLGGSLVPVLKGNWARQPSFSFLNLKQGFQNHGHSPQGIFSGTACTHQKLWSRFGSKPQIC